MYERFNSSHSIRDHPNFKPMSGLVFFKNMDFSLQGKMSTNFSPFELSSKTLNFKIQLACHEGATRSWKSYPRCSKRP